LSLQRQARAEGRTTAEYLRLYALEGKAFANPVITGSVNDLPTWDPGQRAWNPAG